MEDRIYYVEGPEGDILGPLTMIQILEGIAAEVILEDARLCEVGREEWLELSEVVATRNGHGASLADTPAVGEDALFSMAEVETPSLDELSSPAIETALVDSDLDEVDLHEIQTAALHEMDLEEEIREEGLVIEPAAEIDLSGISLNDEEGAGVEEPVLITQDEEISLFAPADLAEPEESGEPVEAVYREPAEAQPSLMPETSFAGLDLDATLLAPPGSEAEFGEISLRATPPTVEPRPGSASGSLDEDFAPPEAFDLGDRPSSEGSEDFRLDLAEESAVHGRVARETGRRPSWLVPAILVAAVPVILGVYFLVSGRGPATEEARDAASSKPLVQAPPTSASDRERALAFLESGRAKISNQDAEGGVAAISKALELDPHLVEAHKDLALALAATGRKTPAIEAMSAYLNASPEDLEAQRARLDWMLATGEAAEAGIVYGSLASERPESAPLQWMAGVAKGESEEAIGFLRRAVDLDPKDAEAHAALAAVYAKLGKPVDAVVAFEKAFAIRPATKAEKKLFDRATEEAKSAKLAEAKDPVAPVRSPEFAGVLKDVRKSLELENYDDAVKALDAAKKQFSKDAEAVRNLDFLRGIAEFEQGRYDQAIAKFESLNPNVSYEAAGAGRGALTNRIALARLAKGDYRGAVRDFDSADGASDPNEYATAKLWEGVALQSLGMDDLAKRTWKQIPDEVGTRVQGEGRGAVKTAQYLTGVLSEKEYLQAVSPIADFTNDMHYFLGRAARERADTASAAEHFKRSLEASRGREFPYALAETAARAD